MYDKNDPITSLITARICHDLVSPIGAIQNGLELLELAGTPPSEEFDLVKQSAQSATATVSFLRIAFRPDASQSEMSMQEVQTLLNARYATRRLSVTWDVDAPQSQSDVALAFLAIMCFESAMPVGGTISVRKSYPTWAFDAVTDQFNFGTASWDCLRGDAEYAGSPSLVHFELLRRLLEHRGIQQDWATLSGGHKYLLTMAKT